MNHFILKFTSDSLAKLNSFPANSLDRIKLLS